MKTIKRRRTEKKTDYKARLRLLKSSLPRIAIRKTNRYIIVQYIKSEEAQDKVLIGITSKDLLEYGWGKNKEGSLKSIPACYLTGLLLGKKINSLEKNKSQDGILDLGLIKNIKKSRVYAVLSGLTDSGIRINHKENILPNEERIKGDHLKNKIDFDKIKNKIIGK